MSEGRKQWHPAFCAGMELELRGYDLAFEREHQLMRGPLSADLLVVRNPDGVPIDNAIGAAFLGHNIVEYKSPGDALSVDDFYKVQGYAALYKASGQTLDAVRADDVTVSYFREGCPRAMFKRLAECGMRVRREHPGVYDVDGSLFPTRVVVMRELPAGEHVALKVLSRGAHREDVEAFLRQARSLATAGDRARADAVLQVSVAANMGLYGRLYEEGAEMCEALAEIMRDDLEARERDGEARLGALMARLLDAGRIDDVRRGATDAAYREGLYREFGMVRVRGTGD